MHFLKKNINNSPFLGIFCAASNRIALVSPSVSKKEEKEIKQTLNVRIIKTTLANSSLLGIIALVFEEKIVIPQIVEKHEKKLLEQQGLEIKQLSQASAFGNLVSLNEFHGLASTLLNSRYVKEIEVFFGIKMTQKNICGSNLPGACMKANGHGFVVNPNVSKEEFEFLEKAFQVKGIPTTANYGDMFVGNGLIANNYGILIGSITTTHEMTRIDEAFRED